MITRERNLTAMATNTISKQSYHGTCWERPIIPCDASLEEAMIFEQLSPEYSSLDALYTTDVPKVAEQFSFEKVSDPENEIQVVVEGHTTLDKALVIDFKYGRVVEFEGKVYSIEHAHMDESENSLTRAHLHQALKESGYDGFVMRGDYQYLGEPADDIAIFKADRFTATAVRLKINNKWTNSLSIDQAKEVFKKWSMKPYLEQGYASKDFAV